MLGRPSREIEAILGYPGRAEMIHRDDMALGRASASCGRPGRLFADAALWVRTMRRREDASVMPQWIHGSDAKGAGEGWMP